MTYLRNWFLKLSSNLEKKRRGEDSILWGSRVHNNLLYDVIYFQIIDTRWKKEWSRSGIHRLISFFVSFLLCLQGMYVLNQKKLFFTWHWSTSYNQNYSTSLCLRIEKFLWGDYLIFSRLPSILRFYNFTIIKFYDFTILWFNDFTIFRSSHLNFLLTEEEVLFYFWITENNIHILGCTFAHIGITIKKKSKRSFIVDNFFVKKIKWNLKFRNFTKWKKEDRKSVV